MRVIMSLHGSTDDGVTEQGRSFWNLHEYYTTYSNNNSLDDKALKKK
ncbi:MAG: hypothetical protein WKG06_40550 [Segetibacter sp.]